jgi:Tfp pilus assembly protein PilZ
MLENDRDSAELGLHQPATQEMPLELRRKRQRASDRLPLDVKLTLWSESHFYSGLSGDTRQGGLFVATYKPLPPGQNVILRVELFGERIEVEGMVQWGRAGCEYAPPGVGIVLRGVPPNAQRFIDAFCAGRAPIYYELENEENHSG